MTVMAVGFLSLGLLQRYHVLLMVCRMVLVARKGLVDYTMAAGVDVGVAVVAIGWRLKRREHLTKNHL
jgi:hypothetical protein